jgi:hypothetical protein
MTKGHSNKAQQKRRNRECSYKGGEVSGHGPALESKHTFFLEPQNAGTQVTVDFKKRLFGNGRTPGEREGYIRGSKRHVTKRFPNMTKFRLSKYVFFPTSFAHENGAFPFLYFFV